jgi:Icc-related predicted phosphoesterase
VLGNHEFYKRFERLPDESRAVAAETNIQVLEDQSTVIDGVRFIGATLWTDFALFGSDLRPEAMRKAKERMNDYKHIKANQKMTPSRAGESQPVSSLRPAHTAERHARTRSFIEETLSQQFDGPTVVVTHHLPHVQSIPPRFADHIGSAAYASDLSSVIENFQPEMWIHGHSHDSADYLVGRTRVICNPRGYPQPDGSPENPNFNPEMIVEL